ncbi:MAG: MBL fold metallo-hydrolase [Gammaproteobacteria bacterium]
MPITALDLEPPEPGVPLEIAPGLYWIRMPLALALNHVNLWLIHDGQMLSIVDTGMDTASTRAAWSILLEGRFAGVPVRRVIATHLHPDHVGLARWLCEYCHAPLAMTLGEYLSARLIQGRVAPADPASIRSFYAQHGGGERELDALEGRAQFYVQTVPALPLAFERLEEGERIRMGGIWEVWIGGGHSPEHAAFWSPERNVLIGGDLLLPRISSNISVFTLEPEGDPLASYLKTLRRLRNLPDEALVLPSHGRPFRGARIRVEELFAHHGERLERLLEALSGASRTAAELIPVLFERKLDRHEIGFAFGETIAHLNRLWKGGWIEREVESGLIRFRAALTHPEERRRSARLALEDSDTALR